MMIDLKLFIGWYHVLPFRTPKGIFVKIVKQKHDGKKVVIV